MANKKKEKLSNLKFISAGTLGDLFIVLCKLITLNQKVELEHYTSHNGMKRLINELYQFFPNIVLNSTVLESKSEVLKKVRKKSENQFFVIPEQMEKVTLEKIGSRTLLFYIWIPILFSHLI